MSDEVKTLARARDYLQALSEGRDPLTGKTFDEDVLSQPRLRRCFAYVAAYLQRDLEVRAAKQNDAIFLPSPAHYDKICDSADLPADEFYRRLNAVAVENGKMPIDPRLIHHFLLHAGLVDGRIESMFVERRVLRANARSEEIGIYDKPVLSPRTGALTHTLMFPPKTQAWLLDCLPIILTPTEETEDRS